FAELRPFLEEARDMAEAGQTHVVSGGHLAKARRVNGWRSCNLRTAFEKLVKRAGLEPWPRLFHNLRSSRETELLESFPVHVVALWMGHDAKVSLKHYAQTTEDHFERAAGAKNGASETQNQAQQQAVGIGGESQVWSLTPESDGVCAIPSETQPMVAKGCNGEGGIRTLGGASATSVFETLKELNELQSGFKPACFPWFFRGLPGATRVQGGWKPG